MNLWVSPMANPFLAWVGQASRLSEVLLEVVLHRYPNLFSKAKLLQLLNQLRKNFQVANGHNY